MLDDERLAPVFAVAQELRVPILIHAGAAPPILVITGALVDDYPERSRPSPMRQFADLAGLVARFAGRVGKLSSTRCVEPGLDLLSFFRPRRARAGAERLGSRTRGPQPP